jgi:2,7-dihydroxy-5-methyl-1-naphthoate 7-O-methyltransferase
MSEKVDLWALSDLATPWSVRVVMTLRIAEHIEAGVTKVDDLAEAAGCHGPSLTRVLRHLVGQGLFEEPAPGEFALNDAARALLEPGLLHVGLDLDGYGGRVAGAWGGLLTATRTGEPGYAEVFGRPFWDDLAAHPEIAESFDTIMGPAGHGPADPAVLVHDDWDGVRHVVDVGGGTGSLLAEILRTHPRAEGTLVDLPRTVARSGEVFAAAGVADRARVSGQSFFDPLPAGADLYLLKALLFDWPDERAAVLLGRCAEAARPDGRVVVIGGVAPERTSGQADLLMMTLTGGKVRSLDQFGELAAGAGLKVTASGHQASGQFLVECRPV